MELPQEHLTTPTSSPIKCNATILDTTILCIYIFPFTKRKKKSMYISTYFSWWSVIFGVIDFLWTIFNVEYITAEKKWWVRFNGFKQPELWLKRCEGTRFRPKTITLRRIHLASKKTDWMDIYFHGFQMNSCFLHLEIGKMTYFANLMVCVIGYVKPSTWRQNIQSSCRESSLSLSLVPY